MSTPQLENPHSARAEGAAAANAADPKPQPWLARLKQTSQQYQRQVHRILLVLSTAQRAYLLSLLLLILTSLDVFSVDLGITLAAMVGISAFMLDAWPAFERVWHQLYGKAFIIALYAVILNIVLAYAEATVNNMTGIKPDLMRYTVNLVAMLLAPAWLFGATVVVMLGYMILHMLKIMLYLVLRPLGIRSRQLFDDEAYPKSFLAIRLLLMPFVCVMMAHLMDAYLTGHSDVTWQTKNDEISLDLAVLPNELPALGRKVADTTSSVSGGTNDAAPLSAAPASAAKTVTTAGLPSHGMATQRTTDHDDVMLNTSTYLNQRIAQAEQHGFHWYEALAAQFLYHVESHSKSSCKISGDEHAIPVGDWDVLIITPKPDAPLGFTFSVRPCQSPGQQWLWQHFGAASQLDGR